MGEFKYKAFISYSHKDKHWARWLHRRLETYAFPKHAIGKTTDFGPVPKNLKPIFRDRDELAAADDLGQKIEGAISQSENLIIICSPAGAASHWVNQEILYFKRHNRGAKIFSVIIEGEPFATGLSGEAVEECLPPALRFQIDEVGDLTNIPAEPLAADLRPQGDGKRLGLLKLISGIAGLGLDDLVQRDLQRARRRVTAITAGAISAVLVMGSLTWFALDARQEAEARRGEAEARTESAEELIEFMVTDLKEKLEPVGRLDALKVVGEQASQYYDQYPLTAHDDDALGRRARVFHYLGQIQDKLGNLDEAGDYFQRAYFSTEQLLERDSKNANRIFEHSQSAYWAGYVPYFKEDYESAGPYFDEYINQAEALNAVEPGSLRALQEKTYAYTNMAILLTASKKKELAIPLYEKAIPTYEKILSIYPDKPAYTLDLSSAYAWMADALEPNYKRAMEYRKLQTEVLREALEKHVEDQDLKHNYLLSIAGQARMEISLKNYEAAENLIDMGLKSAIELSATDDQNFHWIENVALFHLLNAEIKSASDEHQLCLMSLKKYVALKNGAQANPGYNDRFFERHTGRYERILKEVSR